MARSEKKRILVIDREESLRAMIRSLLEGNGFEILEAREGEEGISQATQEKPDLIIADILMTTQKGTFICDILQGDPALKQIPLLMLTTVNLPKTWDLSGGGNSYLARPFLHDQLVGKVSQLTKAPVPAQKQRSPS